MQDLSSGSFLTQVLQPDSIYAYIHSFSVFLYPASLPETRRTFVFCGLSSAALQFGIIDLDNLESQYNYYNFVNYYELIFAFL